LKQKAINLKKEAYIAIGPNLKEFNYLLLNSKEVLLHLGPLIG